MLHNHRPIRTRDEAPRLPMDIRLRSTMMRWVPYFYRAQRAWMHTIGWCQRYGVALLLAALNLAALTWTLTHFKTYTPPPTTIIRMYTNIIHLCIFMVFIIIWNIMVRYQRVYIPRGRFMG